MGESENEQMLKFIEERYRHITLEYSIVDFDAPLEVPMAIWLLHLYVCACLFICQFLSATENARISRLCS